MKQCIKETGGT